MEVFFRVALAEAQIMAINKDAHQLAKLTHLFKNSEHVENHP